MLNRIRKNLINISGIYILLISRLYCALSQTILLLLLRFKTTRSYEVTKLEELRGHKTRGATRSQNQRSYEITKLEELQGHKTRGATRSQNQRSYKVTKLEELQGHITRGATRSQNITFSFCTAHRDLFLQKSFLVLNFKYEIN